MLRITVRFPPLHSLTSVDADGLCAVHKYNQLMKDFPLNELLSATDLDKIQESLILIFGHISRKLRLSPYPIRRALPLVEAISRDFNDQLAHPNISATPLHAL